MDSIPGPAATRVVLLLIDGLRPDAITPCTMPALAALQGHGWSAVGRTVRPSVTVAALSSLATGVGPGVHGLDAERKLPTMAALRRVRPLPAELARHGRRTAVIAGRLPASNRLLAATLLRLGGVRSFAATGRRPSEVAEGAVRHVARARPSFAVVYVNDTDLAGHRDGWMSPAYLDAAHAADGAVSELMALTDDPGTILLVTADHGGGGVEPTDHDAPHPVNDAIPIVAAGAPIDPARSDAPASLLDLPPTILSLLGVPVPARWEGRPLPVLAEARALAA
jgi:predicted AlkP superfamily pyrophosphatase or phosphodiesterase